MFSDITMVAWNDSPCGVFTPGRSLNTIIRSYLLTTPHLSPPAHTPSNLSRDRVHVGSQWIAEAESLGPPTKEEEKENQLVWTWGKVQELYYKRVLQVLIPPSQTVWNWEYWLIVWEQEEKEKEISALVYTHLCIRKAKRKYIELL